MQTKESRIRERAYQLWCEEGFAPGRELDHWIRARDSIELEDKEGTATLPPPVQADGETARTEAEPALAIENQGEFPTLTDQGEGQAAPARPSAVEAKSPPEPRRPRPSERARGRAGLD
ncbi:DUF2934 domain-containing protein [Chelatococcus reniformis]|uniref:DUF2934 domain-containing protein n=1 Tax=Chelatococcus reniformis TaxID=1494448 RepID=A0A916XMU6_9HYPH|nr:hypothetical protein GCM10010994_46880 [Chelatococcus reniformis]